jgi:hypothetical protein
VFENIMLKKMFGSGREEGTGSYIMHSEQLHDFSSSASTIRVIKSRIKWARHVTCKGGRRERHT